MKYCKNGKEHFLNLRRSQCRSQSCFSIPGKYTCWYLSRTDGCSPWLRALSKNYSQFRVSRLAENSLPILAYSVFTNFVLKKMGSIFGRPYQFNCTKIRLSTTLESFCEICREIRNFFSKRWWGFQIFISVYFWHLGNSM